MVTEADNDSSPRRTIAASGTKYAAAEMGQTVYPICSDVSQCDVMVLHQWR